MSRNKKDSDGTFAQIMQEEAKKRDLWPNLDEKMFERVKVRARVERVSFEEDTMNVIVYVRFPDGQIRYMVESPNNFEFFHGKPREKMTEDEIRREMGKHSEVWKKVVGRDLLVETERFKAEPSRD